MKWITLLSVSLFSTFVFAGPTTQAQIDQYAKDLEAANTIVMCSNYTSAGAKNGESHTQMASNDLNKIFHQLQQRNSHRLRMDHLTTEAQFHELCAIVSKIN